VTSEVYTAPSTTPFWAAFANIWLLFLIFPLLAVLNDDDLTDGRRIAAIVLLGAFAIAHLAAYFYEFSSHRHPRGSVLWLSLLIGLSVVGVMIGGLGMLGLAPFLTPFATSQSFSLRTSAVVLAATIVVTVGVLSNSDVLADLFFLPLIVFAVGAGSLSISVAERREFEATAMQQQLTLAEERSRVSRDVHDVLGHSLTAIILKTQVVERQLASIDTPSKEVVEAQSQLGEIHDLSRQALAEIRDTVDGLRATTLQRELSAAHHVLSDADVTLTVDGSELDVPDEYRTVIGWTVREAVTNIVRHARAATCQIELGSGTQLIRITDDGVGRGNTAEGNGIQGLRQRLARHGLELHIDDQPIGTAISVVRS